MRPADPGRGAGVNRLRVDFPRGSSYEIDGSLIRGGNDGVEEAAALSAQSEPDWIVTIIEDEE